MGPSGAQPGPCWGQVGAKWGQVGAKLGPRCPQEGPKRGQVELPRASWEPFWSTWVQKRWFTGMLAFPKAKLRFPLGKPLSGRVRGLLGEALGGFFCELGCQKAARRAQLAPSWAQEGPSCGQDGSSWGQDGPKRGQDGPSWRFSRRGYGRGPSAEGSRGGKGGSTKPTSTGNYHPRGAFWRKLLPKGGIS